MQQKEKQIIKQISIQTKVVQKGRVNISLKVVKNSKIN